jgi:hypothetical protein
VKRDASAFQSPRPRVVARPRETTRDARPDESGVYQYSSTSSHQSPSPLAENDGVLVDVHNHGHRRAFNEAFDEMGYSCSQWSPHIYYDLLRFGDSTGEGLVKAYYEMVGWPIMLSTSDRPAFVEKIYSIKKKAFHDIIENRDFPLRDGAKEFVEQALEAGARLVVLSGTASDPNEHVADAVMDILGDSCRENIQVLNVGDLSGDDAAGSDGDDEDVTFEQLVAQVQGKGKARSASSFVRAMNLQSRGVGMRVDASMLAAGLSTVSPSYFSAVCATNGGCASSSVLVAVSNSLMSSAKGAGLYTCAVPPSLQARGGYTAADGMYDGFGAGGGLTWARLQRRLDFPES